MTQLTGSRIKIAAALGANIVLTIGLLFPYSTVLHADDEAVEVAVGGIRPRKERRISMEKERLTVSLEKVIVEYEFLNTTGQDVITDVAFPTPPHVFVAENRHGVYGLSVFRVWVDGREVKYEVEARAKLNGADCTDHLRSLGIDIATFDDLDGDRQDSQIAKLPKSIKEDLIRLGLLDREDGAPTWTVFKAYHWRQRFPARKLVRVRHEYEPVYGFRPVEASRVRSELKDACIDPLLEHRLSAFGAKKIDYGLVEARWVKYILTAANTWKTPIKHFELIVQEPRGDPHREYFGTSVCWEGTMERRDESHLVGRRANFVPTRELAVFYFSTRYIPIVGAPDGGFH
jgi:hypothetical protein